MYRENLEVFRLKAVQSNNSTSKETQNTQNYFSLQKTGTKNYWKISQNYFLFKTSANLNHWARFQYEFLFGSATLLKASYPLCISLRGNLFPIFFIASNSYVFFLTMLTVWSLFQQKYFCTPWANLFKTWNIHACATQENL